MLAEYLDTKRISLDMEARSYREMLSKMLALSSPVDMDSILDRILERERIMPTALGKGIFLPRVVLEDKKRTEVFVTINHAGLVFDEYSSSVANVIMLFVFSEKDDHAALLAQGLRLLNDDVLRSDLLHCEKPAEVIKAINEWEKE
jgi:mannitol/fructose-specific phosphotransferase system IIA component (Ntr-type)